MNYNVKTIRAAGFEARWTKTRTGAPIIVANAGEGWYAVTDSMWKDAKEVGLREAFLNHTTFGAFFSISI